MPQGGENSPSRGPCKSHKVPAKLQKVAKKFGGSEKSPYICRRKGQTTPLGHYQMEQMKRRGLRMETNREEFALELKTWRLRKNLTQAQAGARFGVSRYTIIRAERAQELSWEMAYRLFALLSKELKDEEP